jgi:hypothetical protein
MDGLLVISAFDTFDTFEVTVATHGVNADAGIAAPFLRRECSRSKPPAFFSKRLLTMWLVKIEQFRAGRAGEQVLSSTS